MLGRQLRFELLVRPCLTWSPPSSPSPTRPFPIPPARLPILNTIHLILIITSTARVSRKGTN